jgi:hypothetical protein
MTATRETLVIGWRETVGLPELGLHSLVAKIDTGARTSALHAEGIRHYDQNGEQRVRFRVPHAGLDETAECDALLIDRREIKNTSGLPEERLIIRTLLVLAGRRWRIDISLADRQAMASPLILGRTALRGHRILINPGRTHLATPSRKAAP